MTTTSGRRTDKVGTCNAACWQAVGPECHCMCNGKNHGIMARGGSQPGRYCQRQGRSYQLVAICEGWTATQEAVDAAYKDLGALPSWRDPKVLQESLTLQTLKWPEVQAVREQSTSKYPNIKLVWARSGPTERMQEA